MRRTPIAPLFIIVVLVILTVPASSAAPAAPLAPLANVAPTVVSYQGQVKISSTTYDGNGDFKFAIVNGSTTYWTNDGTASGEPANAVTLTVSKGLFNVLLGDTTLPGGGMTSPLTSVAFTGAESYLRLVQHQRRRAIYATYARPAHRGRALCAPPRRSRI